MNLLIFPFKMELCIISGEYRGNRESLMVDTEFDLIKALRLLNRNDVVLTEKDLECFSKLKEKFFSKFKGSLLHYFSTPGRTELGGNHTDHNNGRVLAASINLDSKAVASKTEDNRVVIYSEGYEKPFHVDLSNPEYQEGETGTTTALIRGVAAGFVQLGYTIGGFNAVMASDVLPGSGLSSSASIEVLIASVFNALYNRNSINPEVLAGIGRFAENEYFGKPSGLMDQMACAVGGIISIDFEDPENAVVERVDFNFTDKNYSLLVVDTGGSHADLTEDYAAVPLEMKKVAKIFGREFLRGISTAEYLNKIVEIRKVLGDRAVLRGLHFLEENERVVKEIEYLESDDLQGYLRLVGESGNSSFKWLQNIYTTKNAGEQGISLALALSEKYINETGSGACRVHGGGFAGTIQVYLPEPVTKVYIENMEKVFGEGCVQILKIRHYGTVYLNDL